MTAVALTPPSDLCDSISSGRCALFVGAGLSIGAGMPGWEELLSRLVDKFRSTDDIDADQALELKQMARAGKRPLMVAQEICDRAGRGRFLDEIVKIFGDKSKKPTESHLEMPEIPFSIALTTNYDRLLESAYVVKTRSLPTVYTHANSHDFADAIWRQDFFILKAHGTIEARSDIVLTERDYRDIIFRAPGYQAALLSIFTTKTVFFVGVSLNDPEVTLLLSYLFDAFHGSGVNHFALVPDDTITKTEASRWRKDYKVNCIRYTPTSGHPEILEFLKLLPRKSAP
ncbi:MAG: hypothetical protein GXX96_38000 [Planctomycetaceae bacterium]|nr:hypothetical protein [Planctomycetaceae bacterium]